MINQICKICIVLFIDGPVYYFIELLTPLI